jgi:hypothetical protein
MTNLLTFTCFLFIFYGCANRFDNYHLETTEILSEQTMARNSEHKSYTVYIDPLRDSSPLSKKEFVKLREYLYSTLEQIGHKRVYKREQANLMLFFDMKLTGPYAVQRTAINKVWTNHAPEFKYTFGRQKVSLESAYNYLKKIRDIKTWNMHKEKFIFKHIVYISQLELRAFDLTSVRSSKNIDSAKIIWTAKYKSLAESNNLETHLSRILVSSRENFGIKNINSKQITFSNTDERVEQLMNFVNSEKMYQDQRKNKSLQEEYRHLSDDEFIEFYTNRVRPFDITPLYK